MRQAWPSPGKVFVAGNIGRPLLDLAGQISKGDLVVAELSSFQLDATVAFHPWIAVVLNITPDHLDFHERMENYIEAKAKILTRQKQKETAVLNADDPAVADLACRTKAKVCLFSCCRPPGRDLAVGIKDGVVSAIVKGSMVQLLPAGEIKIPGAHNLENSLAAAAAALTAGAQPETIARVLRWFPGVEHRLELVAEINGAVYINDSKGTNPESTIKALEALPGPVVLLAGGYDKGVDFSNLAACFPNHVSHLILLGETREKMAKAAENAGLREISLVGSLQEAVELAYSIAGPGDTVLLSPACASWDMFPNYEERGRLFKQLVSRLGGEKDLCEE